MGQIQFEKQGGVAVFTVDNPDVKNGLTPEMGMQLSALCDEVDADLAIGAAVIRGAGGMFCSGADLRAGFTPQENGKPDFEHDLHERYHPVITGLRALPKPVLVHCSAGHDRTGRVVAHIVDHPHEAVIEHGQRLVKDLLQRRHGRPSRRNRIAALLIDFVALLWRERHGVPGFESPAAL